MIVRAASAAALGLALLGLTGAAAALSSEPVVAPGHAVPVAVGGFDAQVPVTVQLVGSVTGHLVVRADARGRVRTYYPAPSAAGEYRILLSGRAPARPGRVTTPTATGAGDHQAIVVTVPLTIGVPFRVGGSGTDAAGLGPSGQQPSGSGIDGLATTGTDLRTPVVLAAALVLSGLVAVAAGRRRRRS